MKKKIIIIIALMMGYVAFINAQSSAFKFEKLVHDFGKIKEENGKALYKFQFKNAGKTPIIIKNVKSTCGCTTPEYPRTPILPGKSSFISVQYDPHNRPGSFSKQVQIYNNITKSPVILEIRGVVVQKTKQIEDIYKHQLGGIRLKARHLAFARMLNNETKTQTVEFINNSDKSLTLAVNQNEMRDFLGVTISPKTVAPKQKGIIKVTYYAAKNKGMWGYNTARIPITIDGKRPSGYPLSVSSTIVEDFSKLTKDELANAPTMDFEKSTFDFGKIKTGTKITHEFKFKNNGKRDLLIRKTTASCGCTAVEAKRVIKPGKTSVIKIVFNSTGKRGKQHKSVTIITNIPGKNKNGAEKCRTVLRLTGEVTE